MVVVGDSAYNYIQTGMVSAQAIPYVQATAYVAAQDNMDAKQAGKAYLDLSNIIFDQYFQNTEDAIANFEATLDVLGHYYFLAPTQKAVSIMSTFSKGHNVHAYLYYMTYKDPTLPENMTADVGPFHGSDVAFLTGEFVQEGAFLYGLADDDDREVSYSMMRAWATFAKEG